MKNDEGLAAAREAAAQYLRAEGYRSEADLVAGGLGDDFREVRIALALGKILGKPSQPPTKQLGRRLAGEEC